MSHKPPASTLLDDIRRAAEARAIAGPGAEPAARLQPDPPAPDAKPRSREWEKKNKAHAYRIPDSLHARLLEVVDYYRAESFQTNIAMVVATFLEYGLDAWDRGDIEIKGFAYEIVRRPKTRKERR